MLKTYRALFRDLNNQIRYAAWKDCHKLKSYLNGEGDIDLLVDINQRKEFIHLIKEFGFIPAGYTILKFPDVEHFYGFDEDSGKICHLHIYYRMTTGASHLKSYVLPLTKSVFKNRFLNDYDVYEASFNDQSVIYTIRHHLKKASIFGSLLWYREKDNYKIEYNYIQEGLGSNDVKDIKENEGRANDYSDFNSLTMDWSLNEYFKSLKFARSFSEFRRFNSLQSLLASLKNIIILLFIRLLNIKKNFKEGSVIAIAGVDGAGKSSMVDEVNKWLGDYFNVKTMHIGRPSPTILTTPVRILLFFRVLITGKKGLEKNPNSTHDQSARNSSLLFGLIYSFRYIALAYERYRVCIKAKQGADKGGIIITDRYTTNSQGKMDSPRIGTNNSGIIGLLGRLEENIYKRIPESNSLLFLDVDVEEAINRNRKRKLPFKESDDEIETRHKENKNLSYNTAKIITIDANQPYTVVLSNIKREVWISLLDSCEREKIKI